ncbi:Chitin synthase C [Penicillium malachiteum]|uniref:Chitin synthase n=1 Tax=Penicillium malachiteum TaxID=1324776 RepID=A0AAD6HW57_9EURO|nr:Chitin synthase C [Penicillium malachiteum]
MESQQPEVDPRPEMANLYYIGQDDQSSDADPFNSVYNEFDDNKTIEPIAGDDSDLNLFNTSDPLLEKQTPSLNIRRYPTKKIKLEHGHILSLDYPVPSTIQNAVQQEFWESKELGEEFSQLRYTVAVCDPDDFVPRRGYNLRPAMYNRHTELLIAMTYRDENKVLTSRTLHAVMQNIRDICRARSDNTLDTLATFGVFQEGIMKKAVDGKETVAHIFDYTTQLSVTENQELVKPQDDDPMSFPPIQMILCCIKQRSTGKVNSHRWIFNGFCRILNPEVVVLLDTGTKPPRKSLLALWQSFYNDKSLGAAYGEVTSSINGNLDYLNPYVAAQTFAYEKDNVLEKPLESTLGYVTGGLFSAYRYRAVMGRLLEQYFNGDLTLAKKLGKNGLEGMNILKKNIFFAGDRILAFETLAKRGSRWRLSFVKAAKCEVEVPRNLVELMAQRRQDFNRAFAASIHTAIHVGQIYKSDHGPIQLLLFHLQLLYNLAHFILSWFSLGTYGAHLIASIFQLRLWRLLITWWADLIGMSCVANILMVYAFCNWHDVILHVPATDNTSALPQATSQKDKKSAFIEEVDRLQLDIDTQFSEAVQRALKPPDAEGDGWEPMSLEDSYKSFRTYLVLLWISSNILLVIYYSATGTNRFCFTDIPITRLWNYTVATMWSIVVLSLFLFAGSMWFLAKTGVLSCFRKRYVYTIHLLHVVLSYV